MRFSGGNLSFVCVLSLAGDVEWAFSGRFLPFGGKWLFTELLPATDIQNNESYNTFEKRVLSLSPLSCPYFVSPPRYLIHFFFMVDSRKRSLEALSEVDMM